MTELLERTVDRRPIAAEEQLGRPRGARANRLGVLGRIAEQRRADLAGELAAASRASLRRAAAGGPPPRDPLERLLRPGLHLIAEIKRRSPSAGELASADVDVVARARAYERGGAAMISVLVEPRWFGGSVDDLRAVRAAVSLPVLAKDFIVEARQMAGLRAAGADAVLLLAALHPARRLRSLVRAARLIRLEPLVEIHSERELERALASEARLIGINNRDLRSQAVDPELAARLRPRIPDDRLVVAESGVSDPATLAAWRALGFDAALIGEALMTAGDDPAAIEGRVAAFVAAGRESPAGMDPAAADRAARVKICGITDAAGLEAALRAGADAIGLNFVPGTPRCLSERAGARLAAAARASAPPERRPRLVGVIADADPDEAAALAARLDLDALQLSGDEPPEDLPRYRRSVTKVLHLPAELPDDAASLERMAATIVERGRAYLAQPNAIGLMLDTADPHRRGGTGRAPDRRLAALVARELPVTLAGGLDAGNVAAALRETPAVAVDVASGVERRPGPRTLRPHRPRKDPFRVGLFVKRARAARLDQPTAPARPTPVHPGLLDPDANGRWGTERQFGGRFVPETLVAALVELEDAYRELRTDPRFWAELRELGLRYVGRPSPLYRADRLATAIERMSRRRPGRLRLYLKREDLAHTGAHKINNALGQALLTRRLGKTRVIAETGAGQHGVAAATACALLDLPCVVYMGAEDVRRQAPNVLRMRALGAEVRSVSSGSATLKDAINEAMRDWVTNVGTTHYVLGSAVGPHPYPLIVRDLQRVIGDEAAAQLRADGGRLPDAAVACLGGGSNAIGLFSRFIGEPAVRLIGVEAAGEGLARRHAAALSGGRPGVLHGARSYLLQDDDGQVLEAHSISAGLDYPGIGPQLSALYAAGRMEVHAATDREALEALRLVTRSEGILPALEPAHAVAVLPRVLEGDERHAPLPDETVVLLGLSGRGDKDLGVLGGDEG